jgi:hypothetical protein
LVQLDMGIVGYLCRSWIPVVCVSGEVLGANRGHLFLAYFSFSANLL